MRIVIDGVEYEQPECHCNGGGHICYLRPAAKKLNVSVEKILAALKEKI